MAPELRKPVPACPGCQDPAENKAAPDRYEARADGAGSLGHDPEQERADEPAEVPDRVDDRKPDRGSRLGKEHGGEGPERAEETVDPHRCNDEHEERGERILHKAGNNSAMPPTEGALPMSRNGLPSIRTRLVSRCGLPANGRCSRLSTCRPGDQMLK